MFATMLRFANLVVFALLLSTAAGYTYTPCDPCIDQASNETLETLQLGVYGDTIDDRTEVPLSDPLALGSSLNWDECTYLYTYGWTGESLFLNRQSRDAVVRALIESTPCNVLYLNWTRIAASPYSYARRSVEAVAYKLSEALDVLIANGLYLPGLHLIGHSLGAQISGLCGKTTHSLLPRITGLDPAGPGFDNPDRRLNEMDAGFVSVIHTDGGVLGFEGRSGHVDFHPNGGRNPQPGCELADQSICSHYRACYLLEEYVRDASAFIGVICNSYEDFQAGLCSENEFVAMSLTTPVTARGTVYFQTNGQSPFGRREDGTRYQAPVLL